MNLKTLRDTLAAHPEASLRIVRADGQNIPAEFHVTEVGRSAKHFIDCGGTVRKTEACTLQIWVAAGDEAHRLGAAKLLKILRLAEKIVSDGKLPVEAEYQGDSITLWSLEVETASPAEIVFRLAPKSTDCLAPDKCGVPGATTCCAPRR